MMGYVHQNWTHGTLVAVLFWAFSTGLGAALMDEYKTKPTMRFSSANLYMGMMFVSIITTIIPFGFIFCGLIMEVDAPEVINPVPSVVYRVLSCQDDPQADKFADAMNSSSLVPPTLREDCEYFTTYLLPSFQFDTMLKWAGYCLTLISMLVGIVVWFYGLYCYFARLACVRKIFRSGGQLECIPYEFKSSWSIVVNGHLEDPILEMKMMAYFTDMRRRREEKLEDFLDEAVRSSVQIHRLSLALARPVLSTVAET
ncbi:hypothetical protein RvY_01511 [Ramazzottius varieornatus]|uniref:Uncharacterized protein n=1 Tax=Ramazzottius varieornatus TaxID=947166 RepID=A0A1D1URA3_RAMVA|nr:hypothetical protein RvY_01511 [Ramazzottius varieornatus]